VCRRLRWFRPVRTYRRGQSMNPPTRPHPKHPTLLFVHNGSDYRGHMQHLTDAGLRVTETQSETALAETLKLQPDLIVLDFGFDGTLTAQLKGHSLTRHIPVIALTKLT